MDNDSLYLWLIVIVLATIIYANIKKNNQTCDLEIYTKPLVNQPCFTCNDGFWLKSEPRWKAVGIKKIEQYSNLYCLDHCKKRNWIKVAYQDSIIGYAKLKHISRGTCKIHHTNIRRGAVCSDGSTSSSTAQGTCSHHGGVYYWLYCREIEITIDDQTHYLECE